MGRSLWGKARRHFLTREFLLFLLIGCFNTFHCSALAKIITLFLPDANLAFNIGYLVSNVAAYALNACYVFPEPMHWRGYLKFFLSYVPNYAIQNVIVLVFYNMLGFPDIAAFLLAAVLGVPVTFLFVKIFAFGRR